jgi:hypothetical protein
VLAPLNSLSPPPSPLPPQAYPVSASIRTHTTNTQSNKIQPPKTVNALQRSRSKGASEALTSQYSAPISTSAILHSPNSLSWPPSYQAISGKPFVAPVSYPISGSIVGRSPLPVPQYPPIHSLNVVQGKPRAKIVPQISPLYTSSLVNRGSSASRTSHRAPATLDSFLRGPLNSHPYVLGGLSQPIRPMPTVRLHSFVPPTHFRYL